MDRLDPVTGKFTHFRHDLKDSTSLSHDFVRAILEDRAGNLWIGTHGGLDRFDPKTEKFVHYRYDSNDSTSLSCNRVRAICEDRAGTLWIGTGSNWPQEGNDTNEGGLNRMNKLTGKFIRYLNDPKNPHTLINKVRAIFEDSKVFLGRYRRGWPTYNGSCNWSI